MGDTFEAHISFQVVPVSVKQKSLEHGCMAASAPEHVQAKRSLWGLGFFTITPVVQHDESIDMVIFVCLSHIVFSPVGLVVEELFHL